MKCLLSSSAKNYEEYSLQLRVKQITCFIISIVLAIVAIFVFKNTEGRTHLDGYRLGVIVGMGFGLFAVAIKLTFSLKNKEKIKEKFIEDFDERNVMIILNVSRIMFLIIVICLAISIIVSAIFSYFLSSLLALILCAILVLYVIVYIIYNKLM